MRCVRGPALFAIALGCLTSRPAGAQDSNAVRLEVTLSADSTSMGARFPVVRTFGLIESARWLSALRSGFPLRLRYRVEIWRSVDGWFDGFSRAAEWDVLVLHEPLMDQYTVTRIIGGSRRENRYATLDALATALGVAYRIAVTPSEAGRYYYRSVLNVTALSDSDLDELSRYVGGDLNSSDEGTQDSGSAVGRGAKRLVLRLAGFPSEEVTARSGRFEVRSKR